MRAGLGAFAFSLVVACGSTSHTSSSTGGGGSINAAGAAGSPAGSGGSGGQAGSVSSGGQAGAGGSVVGAAGAGGSNITVGSCDAFTPCGGDVEGTWTYTSACVDSTALADAVQQACANATTDTHGVVDGTLIFSGGTVVRSGNYVVTADIHVPPNCVIGSCAVVQGLLAGALPGVTCQDGGAGSCDCIASRTGGSIAAQSYTAAGNTITLADGRTFDYCVTGNTLVYTETTANAEPGTYALSR